MTMKSTTVDFKRSSTSASGLVLEGLGCLAMGAAAMFVLDPRMGRRRRAVARDKLVSGTRHACEGLDEAARDLWHRTYGMFAEARHLWDGAHRHDGAGSSRGSVGHQRNRQFELAQENWSPGTRLLMGATGLATVAAGFGSGRWWGLPLGLGGLGIFLRAATNLSFQKLFGFGADRGIQIRKEINISAPPEEVFDYFANYDNFPLFMHNVREVKDLGGGRSQWTVLGPAGVPVQWESIMTGFEPSRSICWQTADGSVVSHRGSIRLDENPDGSTRIDVRLCYAPPAGAIGHAMASIFGADPKAELDGDLARLKMLIERGRFPHDKAKPVTAVE